ncbi:MAG: metal-dependent hydrolase [Halobacteriales archaeon]|nr:metal-dependent hydrolase [Halobacteriales archaeon]
MFIGHGFLAFALVATLAYRFGLSRERTLAVGLLGGLFGLAPDVDMAYAFLGLFEPTGENALRGFWAASTEIHRVVTHSLVIGSVFGFAAGGIASDRPSLNTLAALAFAAGVVVAFAVSGGLAGIVVALLAVTVTTLSRGARRYGLGSRWVAVAAVVGLCSHPFGDLLTGTPPAFLYPFDVTLVAARPNLLGDPTLNLLAPLVAELATFWLALAVYLWISHDERPFHPVRRRLRTRAGLATLFAAFVIVAPAPTLHTAYLFVFSLLAVSLAVATPLPALDVRSLTDLRGESFTTGVTGLAAITLATATYTVAYLAV